MWKYLHSVWGGFVLLLLAYVIVHHMWRLLGRKPYVLASDFRLALFGLVVYVLQLLLGIGTYVNSPYFEGILNGKFGFYMKNAHDRLIVIEHPTMAFLGLLFMLYGFRRMYYQIDYRRKYISIILFYTLALIMVLLRLPWADWL